MISTMFGWSFFIIFTSQVLLIINADSTKLERNKRQYDYRSGRGRNRNDRNRNPSLHQDRYSQNGDFYGRIDEPKYDPVNYYYPHFTRNEDDKLKEYNPYDFNDINPIYKQKRLEYKKMEPEYVNIDTSFGLITGYRVYLYDGPRVPPFDRPKDGANAFHKVYRNVTVFKGIPYAEKPTGEERFKPPKPFMHNWGSIDGRYYGPVCPQHDDYIGDKQGQKLVNEDCLYLNIFTPSVKRGTHQRFAVMVYIHGGFYSHGSANRFPAHMLSASMEVVVVTFNYRLGVLGFLSTTDDVSPGNYGILDQAMAIRWVHENIEIFNGDPERITLFGPGAGAASAGLHALSPQTKGYFHRIIAQSGSMLAEWAITADPEFTRNTTRIYGEKVGCTLSSSHSFVNCLRNRKPAELVNAKLNTKVGWLPWTPVIDWYTQDGAYRFLKDLPERLLEGKLDLNKDLDYMCGFTVNEAALMLLNDKDLALKDYKITEKIFHDRIWKYVDMYNYTLNPEGVFNAINFMYTPWSDPQNKTLLREAYTQMLTDSYFVAPSIKLNHLLLKNGIKPYMYVLNTTLESKNKENWRAVPHDTELYYITGAPFMDPEFYPDELDLKRAQWEEADRNMSEFIMKTWTNFAKYGNPNKPTNSFNIKWEPMSLTNKQYLSLNTTNSSYTTMQINYKEREAAFWTEYIPQLIDRILPTWAPTVEPWYEERRVIRAALWGTVAAAVLFLILMVVCCALYCCKKRQPKYMDDDHLPHYNAPYIVGTEKKSYVDDVTINHNAMKKEHQTSV